MKKHEEEFLQKLKELYETIGWDGMAMYNYDTGDVHGMIIGRKQFIDQLIEQFNSFEEAIRSIDTIPEPEAKVDNKIGDNDDENGPTYH